MIRHFTVSAIVLRGDSVLLIEHRKAGLMLPPGGHIEPNEDPIQAVHREVKEEVGLDIEIIVGEYFTHPTATTLPLPFTINVIDNVADPLIGPHAHIDLVYVCRPLTNTIRLNDQEAGGYAWVPLPDVAGLNTSRSIAALVTAAARFAAHPSSGVPSQYARG